MIQLNYNEQLLWSSDWAGDEVGFPEHEILGLWNIRGTDLYVYINPETNHIVSGYELKDE